LFTYKSVPVIFEPPFTIKEWVPTAVATPSNDWFCGRSFAGIMPSDPAEGMDFCLFECCQIGVSAVGLFTRPE